MLMIPVEDIRNRDWSPEYGTVTHVRHDREEVILTFQNGNVMSVTRGTEMKFNQGGR